jgi:MoxR-like ATPase
MSTTENNPTTPQEVLRRLRDHLTQGLVERDVAVRLALLGALAGEHLVLLGPPGTAKSLVARRLHLAFQGSAYFERLLTRFTVPEELFGPLSIKGLEQDRYERLTAGYLPTASIAFLDEIFKANSAILNALLTLLNEREFDNGTTRVASPLVAVIGASNELPEGEELDALFDRFLLRLHVGPVSKEGFTPLLRLRGEATPTLPKDLPLSTEWLEGVRRYAQKVDVPAGVEALLVELRDWCTANSIAVSDRRWRKVVKLLQVSALTNGRNAVSIWDCWLLQHCLWSKPEQRALVYDWYAQRVGTTQAMDPSRLTKLVVAWESQLEADRTSRSQARDKDGELLWVSADGTVSRTKWGEAQATRDGEPLFLAPTGPTTALDRRQRQIADRTNGGAGFTCAELDQMYVTGGNSIPYGMQMFSSWSGRGHYLVKSENWLKVRAANVPHMEPTWHKPVYVNDCLRQVQALRVDLTSYGAKLAEHIRGMETAISSHLWVTRDFVEPARATLDATRRSVDALITRADALIAGVKALPRDE